LQQIAIPEFGENVSIYSVVEQRYTKDGNIWTAAGVSAGIDMALAFIADVAGKDVAGKVQMYAEYFPENKNYVNSEDATNLPAYLKSNI